MEPVSFLDGRVTLWTADCIAALKDMPEASVNCVVTSPPYFGLRDYQCEGQIGLESSFLTYIGRLLAVFDEVRRVLREDGTCFVNLGDSYAGSWGAQSREHARKHAPNVSAISANQVKAAGIRASGTGAVTRTPGLKPKDLMMIPARFAIAMQSAGWWLRSNIVWGKPNGMPGSQEDRCTSSHESVFMFSKSADYWSDFDAIKTPPRESTLIRIAQDVQAQAGGHRANGEDKSNGTMKAVGGLTGAPHGRHALGDAIPEKERRSDKQRGHSRRDAGFNDRWDAMERSEQMAQPAMMRDVWFVSPAGYEEAHFAVMPDEIARRCILAGCPKGGLVLDPFGGAGTTALVALRHGRRAALIELNPEYAEMARRRIETEWRVPQKPVAPDFGPLFAVA
jgi:DNA modification methylase